MPTAKLVTIGAWSYSRHETYDACPKRAKFLYIDKLPEPDSKFPALQHGTRVHALAAAWVTKRLPDFKAWDGKGLLQYKAELEKVIVAKTIPLELLRFEKEFKRLIKNKAQCEEMWCLDKDWQFIEGSGWSPHVWLRIKVDVHFIEGTTAYIVDHKTGKFNPEHSKQRSIYAIGALTYYPDAKEVRVYHWYLDQGIEKGDIWNAKDLKKLRTEWTNRTRALLTDTTFKATPSDQACKWCSFRKDRGGPCEY